MVFRSPFYVCKYKHLSYSLFLGLNQVLYFTEEKEKIKQSRINPAEVIANAASEISWSKTGFVFAQ